MKILIITQVIDKKDPVLGFFHRWVEAFSKRAESTSVICLYKGESSLPNGVRVYSLGKENKKSRMVYLFRFLRYILSLRGDYDAVFVHMNEEYVLLGGIFWFLMGKNVFLWRNHYDGSWKTNLAALLSTRVFYTSAHSYTARFTNSSRMPVGIDTDFFSPQAKVRKKDSILFLSRMAPSKNPDILIEAISILKKSGSRPEAGFYGDPLPKDEGYYKKLKSIVSVRGLSENISFYRGVSNDIARDLFSSHDIFVNTSKSGMFDKTIFEAYASGALAVSSSKDLRGEVDERVPRLWSY